MKRLALTLVVLAAAVAATLLMHRQGKVRFQARRPPDVSTLGGSVEPLSREFNRWRRRPRLLAVLAPACPVCRAGALAIRDELLSADNDLAVLVVWMPALPLDISGRPGGRVELLAGYPRVTQFFDDRQVAGRAVSELLGWPEQSLAWDVYLFFPAGVTWRETPPEPAAWFHQRLEADPRRYRTGPELAEAMRETAVALAALRGGEPAVP